jgi:hypothetical protein
VFGALACVVEMNRRITKLAESVRLPTRHHPRPRPHPPAVPGPTLVRHLAIACRRNLPPFRVLPRWVVALLAALGLALTLATFLR